MGFSPSPAVIFILFRSYVSTHSVTQLVSTEYFFFLSFRSKFKPSPDTTIFGKCYFLLFIYLLNS